MRPASTETWAWRPPPIRLVEFYVDSSAVGRDDKGRPGLPSDPLNYR